MLSTFFTVSYIFSPLILVLSGDPDIFISEPPVYYPTRRNYTFISAMYGSDTVTIQYDDPLKSCMPSSTQTCDFYIGIYSWGRIAQFTLTATLDTGFYDVNNLIALRDGVPQSGTVKKERYVYYKFDINNAGLNVATLITATVSYLISLFPPLFSHSYFICFIYLCT